MGMDPFNFADALLGTLAQRLARALCKACREQYEAPADERDEVLNAYGTEAAERHLGIGPGAPLKLWRGRGCDACGGTGYKGRVGLHELLVVDDTVKRAIQRRGTAEEIRTSAMQAGMTTLLQDGIAKSIAGLTDLRQVLSVCTR
jgi:type II secretory ATPase GspE/PulE/Tfp pilus assembly ATPase PilB-like protein